MSFIAKILSEKKQAIAPTMSDSEVKMRAHVREFMSILETNMQVLEQINTALVTLERHTANVTEKLVTDKFLESMDGTLFKPLADGHTPKVWLKIKEIMHEQHRNRCKGDACQFLTLSKKALILQFMQDCPAYDESDYQKVEEGLLSPQQLLLGAD